MKNKLQVESLVFWAWATSVVATLGSLFFSEIMRYIPCSLCWYQRIFMYPLVILLGMGVVKKDTQISAYVLPLSIIGGCISIYHYLVQKVAFIGESSISCGLVPCTGEYINWLGFITIPFLALVAFTIITILNILVLKSREEK